MASQGYGNISREEKEAFLKKKMEDMKKKSEEILRRHAEIEADKRNADMLSDMVSTKIQVTPQTQSRKVVKSAKSTSNVQKEKLLEKLNRGKSRNDQQISEDNFAPLHKESEHRKKFNEESEHRKKFNEDDGPPPDPVNYLADPYRDGSFPEVDRTQDSRRHRSNYGGENFHNVKPVMQQRRNYERQHPPPPSSNNHLSMSVQMTGKERKEYENWKAERLKIDEERIARQKTSSGTWKREWDMDKTQQEEAAKKGDKQFYKQPRWISESDNTKDKIGDHQDQTKKTYGKKGQFNSSFEYRRREKGDRSVMIDEHDTLTITKSSHYADEQTLDSQHQRNHGERKISELKQSSLVADERVFYIKKDSNRKQNEEKTSDTLKGDGWEEVSVEVDGTRWANESSAGMDTHPLQQTNNSDREWKAGTRYSQKRNDRAWENRAFSDETCQKNNSNVGFPDKQFVKRHNSSDKARRFSGEWQAGQYNNNVRKHEDGWKDDTNWNRARNNESKKVLDGWENIDGVNKTQNARGRLNSDGWEKEENCNNVIENSYRRSSSDGNGSFDSSFYEHKQRYFSGERSRGSSFKGSNNRVFSSNETGNQYLGNRKHENTNQRAFASSENRQFRDKYAFKTDSSSLDGMNRFDCRETGRIRYWRGSKRGIDQGKIYRGNSNRGNGNVYRENFDRTDGFDGEGGMGRSKFWKGKERGNYQGKTSRGRSNEGNGNAYRANRNSRQEYHSKSDSITNSGTDDFSNLSVKDVKCETVVANDGWEYEPSNELQTSSVKWIEDDENKDPQKPEKSAAFVKTVDAPSPADADTESHDDSWEDMTSGCESEISDVGDGATPKSNAPVLTEGNPFGNENESGSIIASGLGIDKFVESTDYCVGIDTDFSGIIVAPFVSSHNDNIEKILEEVYNDTIKSEHNQHTETTLEQNVAEVSGDCHIDRITIAQNASSFENIRYEDSAVSSSLDHIVSDNIVESVESSGMCYEGTDNEKSNIVETAASLTLDKDTDETSFVEEDSICETIVASSLGAEYSSKCDNIKKNNGLQVASSPVSEDCKKVDRSDNFCSESEISLSVSTEDTISEVSDKSAVEPNANNSHVQLTKIQESVEFSSAQNKFNQSVKMEQISEPVIVQTNANCKMPEMAQDGIVDSFSENIFSESEAKHIAEDTASNTAKSSSEGPLLKLPAEISDDVIKDSEQVLNEETKSDLYDLISANKDANYKLLESMGNDFIDSTSTFSTCENKSESTKEYDAFISCLSSEIKETKNNNCSTIEGFMEPLSSAFNEVSNNNSISDQTKEPSQIKQSSSIIWEAIETEECNMTSSSTNIVNKCEDVYAKICSESKSENNSRVLESTIKLNEALNISCSLDRDNDSHVSTTQPLQMISKKEDASDNGSEIDSDSAQQTHLSASILSNKVRSSVSLPEVRPDISSAKSAREGACMLNDEEISSHSSDYTVNNYSATSEHMDKLKEESGSVDISVQLLPHSDSVVDNNLSTANGCLKNGTLPITSEKPNEVSPSVIHSEEKTKEQILESDISNCETFASDAKCSRDPLPRTVRKASTTESTTEFTEVLEVTTSVPQRILVQDSDSIRITCKDEHIVNKTECEQISDCSS